MHLGRLALAALTALSLRKGDGRAENVMRLLLLLLAIVLGALGLVNSTAYVKEFLTITLRRKGFYIVCRSLMKLVGGKRFGIRKRSRQCYPRRFR